LAQQIHDLKEQLNTLKAETGKGTDVSVTLQLVQQLASAPHHIRDPFAILAALRIADEARVSGDPSASRYEAILRQSRPLSSSPDFGNSIFRLLGNKEESDVADSIAKMTRQRTPGYFHPYARWNQPQHSGARGASSRGARRGARARGICFNCGQRGHFKKKCTSFLAIADLLLKEASCIFCLFYCCSSLFFQFCHALSTGV